MGNRIVQMSETRKGNLGSSHGLFSLTYDQPDTIFDALREVFEQLQTGLCPGLNSRA